MGLKFVFELKSFEFEAFLLFKCKSLDITHMCDD